MWLSLGLMNTTNKIFVKMIIKHNKNTKMI